MERLKWSAAAAAQRYKTSLKEFEEQQGR
eukprot:SAG31_NODE_25914_length_451_cov_1.434659_1_plen_28_part_10